MATAQMGGVIRVTTKADILFVVDDSPSMANEQDKLAAAFPELVDRLDALDPPVDWRVAVMTTSVDERFGPCVSGDATAPQACSAAFGGTGFACESGACVRRFDSIAGRLVSASGNPAVIDRSRASRDEVVRQFRENVRVGLDGSRHEQPLRALSRAFGNGGLDGFWRPDARLVVLVASDEDDCSDSSGRFVGLEQTSSGFEDRCEESARNDDGALDSLAEWIENFRNLPVPGGVREVAFGAITGLGEGTNDPGMCTDPSCAAGCEGPSGTAACDSACDGALQPERCRDECRGECVRFCGAQVPGRRLARTARAMSGPLASICEPSFGPALAELASVMGIPEEMELPSKPSDRRAFFFQITRDGTNITCEEGRDYTLDLEKEPPLLTIDQSSRCRLMPGDEWRVRYVAE